MPRLCCCHTPGWGPTLVISHLTQISLLPCLYTTNTPKKSPPYHSLSRCHTDTM